MNNEAGDRKPQDMPGPAEHWPHISRQWKQVGPPLRPSPEDVGFVTDAIGARSRDHRPLRALILGVTPELYRLPWPEKTKVLGSDHTQAMIDDVWPGPRSAVLRTNWTDLPLRSGSCDLVLCDGGIHLLPHPDGQRRLVQTLHRVVAKDGLCIFRLFVPPRERETPDEVLHDLLGAKIPNLNVLKLRLGMAMQEDSTRGVELGRVWEAFHRAAPDFSRLAAQIGWPLEQLQVINTYRNSPMRYYFMSVSDVRHLFCRDPGGFEFEKIYSPTYELGERCPTVVFRRADTLKKNSPRGNAP